MTIYYENSSKKIINKLTYNKQKSCKYLVKLKKRKQKRKKKENLV